MKSIIYLEGPLACERLLCRLRKKTLRLLQINLSRKPKTISIATFSWQIQTESPFVLTNGLVHVKVEKPMSRTRYAIAGYKCTLISKIRFKSHYFFLNNLRLI